MAYKVTASEKLRGPGAEHETKSLLYLMSLRPDSKDIDFFVIDFFNDVSGVDRYPSKVWDIQSKAASNLSPKEIGKCLVTLFKNYNQKEIIPFKHFILFVGGVSNTVRINSNLNEFDISNVQSSAISKIIEGLTEKSKLVGYIENQWISDENIKNFLNHVTFHISQGDKKDYIKRVINQSIIRLPNEAILESIFDEIKNTQSAKKDIVVENQILNRLDEFLYYNKHLKRNEIFLLILNRIINNNVLSTSIPQFFIPIYNEIPESIQKDKIEDCQNAMALILHDKNNQDNIWLLYENIYNLLNSNPQKNVNDIYDLVDNQLMENVAFLDALSLKYLISLIKGGLNDN